MKLKLKIVMVCASAALLMVGFQNCSSGFSVAGQSAPNPNPFSDQSTGDTASGQGGQCGNPSGPNFFSNFTTAPDRALGQSQSFASGQYVWVSSQCGLFESSDEGQTFHLAAVPPGHDNNQYVQIYADANWFYISNFRGVYRRPLGGGDYQYIFNSQIATQVISQNPPPCAAVGYAANISMDAIYAQGDLILLASGGMFFVSRDGAKSWDRIKLFAGSYEISLFTGTPEFIPSPGGILLRVAIDLTQDGANSLSSTGQCVENRAVVSKEIPAVGFFMADADNLSFRYMPTAPGMAIAATADSNGSLLAYTVTTASDGTQTSAYYRLASSSGWTLDHAAPDSTFPAVRSTGAMTLVGPTLLSLINSQITSSNDFGISMTTLQQFVTNFRVKFIKTDHQTIITNSDGVWFWDPKNLKFVRGKAFSSSFCSSNLLSTEVAGGSGNQMFIMNAWRQAFVSTDAGKSFSSVSMGRLNPDEVLGQDGVLYSHQNYVGLSSSSDNGQNWTPAVTQIQTPGKPSILRIARNDKVISTSGAEGIYYSQDGTNQWSQVTNYVNQLPDPTIPILSAVSMGDRIILYAMGVGVVTLKGGTPVALLSDVGSSGTGQGVRLRIIGSSIYAIATQLWRSDDLGLTFHVVPNTPLMPTEIFQVGNRLILMSWGALYYSEDNGQSFKMWTGCLL